ncbi:hypothetical protein SAMN05216282_105181 [Cryobacterium psychrotolerans]|uniref:ABC transporter ATP-binding protein n=1 Tax=Cryobacterium psychrotolerans TaxID=386301 RepID=A0A1G9BGV1_9MICO|nr:MULTISPECIES: hypothetical protein [Cryobacterium]SDK38749.1 hypothetical protein SAMN05216282_105181 [Cryobacterium psychrotolerans]
MTQNTPHQPSRSDRMKPAELIGFSGVLALVVGLVVLMSTRQVVLSVISLGVTFIVVLISVAMFTLNMKPNDAEKTDLDEQNHGA